MTSFFAQNLFDNLMTGVRNQPAGILHLSARTVNALAVEGIGSLGSLVDAACQTESPLPVTGSKTITEIQNALERMTGAIRPDGSVDWIEYAEGRNFAILPEKNCGQYYGRSFLRAVPGVAEAAVRSKYGDRGNLILRKYIMPNERGSVSLRELGRRLGHSRQAAGLIRSAVLGMLRGAMLRNDYTSCRFRIRPALVAPLHRLSNALISYKGLPLLYSTWSQMLTECIGGDLNEARQVEGLLLSLFNYHLVHGNAKQFQPILLSRDRKPAKFRTLLEESYRLLTKEYPRCLSQEEISYKIACAIGSKPDFHDLTAALGSLKGAVHFEDRGESRIRLEQPVRITDHLEQILLAKGVPVHIRELAEELARFRGTAVTNRSRHNIGVALSEDSRFKPVGRSGYWILTRWSDMETRTIADIAADLIRECSGPLTENELYRLISARRVVKFDAILSLLREDGRFLRVAPRTWNLKQSL